MTNKNFRTIALSINIGCRGQVIRVCLHIHMQQKKQTNSSHVKLDIWLDWYCLVQYTFFILQENFFSPSTETVLGFCIQVLTHFSDRLSKNRRVCLLLQCHADRQVLHKYNTEINRFRSQKSNTELS